MTCRESWSSTANLEDVLVIAEKRLCLRDEFCH